LARSDVPKIERTTALDYPETMQLGFASNRGNARRATASHKFRVWWLIEGNPFIGETSRAGTIIAPKAQVL
jgi:hypothetical protein